MKFRRDTSTLDSGGFEVARGGFGGKGPVGAAAGGAPGLATGVPTEGLGVPTGVPTGLEAIGVDVGRGATTGVPIGVEVGRGVPTIGAVFGFC
jgi:hypothetical protein